MDPTEDPTQPHSLLGRPTSVPCLLITATVPRIGSVLWFAKIWAEYLACP